MRSVILNLYAVITSCIWNGKSEIMSSTIFSHEIIGPKFPIMEAQCGHEKDVNCKLGLLS